MTLQTKNSRPAFWPAAVVTMLLSGSMVFINLNEFYKAGLLRQLSGYPFGGEGATPYYYKTAALYATVNLVWGLLFLFVLLLTSRIVMKRQGLNTLWLLGATLFLIALQFIQGQNGT